MSEEQTRPLHVLIIKLCVLAVAMFAFALWVMPPLYTLFCEVTGLRKVGGAYEAIDTRVDTDRLVTVQFVATQNHKLPWDFKPAVHKIQVHPGEKTRVQYLATNHSANNMVVQAIPSISPFNAVNYFHKIECFCFNQQPLAAGASAELGLEFVVDLELPKQVTTITLSYTLFDITDRTPAVPVTEASDLIKTDKLALLSGVQ